PETDFWLGQRVSRGLNAVGDEGWDQTGPTVIIECIPLPLKARARLFRDGIDIVVPPTRRVPPDSLSPRAKTHNYLNLITADLEAKAQDKEAWSVLLDTNGHLAEGIGSNIFRLRDGAVVVVVLLVVVFFTRCRTWRTCFRFDTYRFRTGAGAT